MYGNTRPFRWSLGRQGDAASMQFLDLITSAGKTPCLQCLERRCRCGCDS